MENKAFTESEVVSAQGSEVIIYDHPIEIPNNSNYHLMMYVFFQIGSELIFKALLAIFIIIEYSSSRFSIVPLVLLIIGYQLFKTLMNFYYIVSYGRRTPQFNTVYFMDIFLAIGYGVVFVALLAVLKGYLSPTSLPLLVIPHIILTTARLFIGEVNGTPYLPGSIYCFIESFQILYIAMKFSSPENHANWTWVLLFYYIVAIIYLIIAIVLLIVLLIFVMSFIFNSDIFREYSNLVKFLVSSVIFYLVWNGIAMYYLLTGFDFLLEAKIIGLKTSKAVPNPRLYAISWFILICALLTLILLFISYRYLKESLLQFFNKDKPREISLQSFAKNLKLNIEQVSGSFFKKGANKNDPGSMYKSNEMGNPDTCIICCLNPSDVMFHPCKHSGMCQECLKQYLKDKDTCPHCREKVEKAFLIFYDQKKKTYMARGVVKIKK